MATERPGWPEGTLARLTVHVLEDVENGEDLPVVGHQRLSHHVGRRHQALQELQGGADHLAVPGVQGVCRAEGQESEREQNPHPLMSISSKCRGVHGGCVINPMI